MFVPIKPDGDKETRLDAQTAKVEQGDVLLPSEAPWLKALQNELMAFPLGRHDDQVDAFSQFLYWLGHSKPQNFIRTRLNGDKRVRPRSRVAFHRNRS